MLKVVLDTNIILASLSSSSPYHNILVSLFRHNYLVVITNDILLEYEEKIAENFNVDVANSIIAALLQNRSVIKIDTFFSLNIISADTDDNKFTDASFAGNVNYLVTNDKHFNILRNLDFPKINLLDIQQFFNLVSQLS